MEFYREKLIQHYHNPANYGSLENPDFSSEEINPSCGDIISLQGYIKNNRVTDIRFTGKGCIISQATASLLTQDCKGKEISVLLDLDQEYIHNLLQFRLGPLRLKCALLSLHALQEGIKNSLIT